MKKLFLTFCFIAFATLTDAQIVINVDANQRGPMISPTHYGIFFEDINHAADGGLYAELIRNRSFEDGKRFGQPADMQFWHVKADNGADIDAKLIKPGYGLKLLNDVQQNALELNINAQNNYAYLINDGF